MSAKHLFLNIALILFALFQLSALNLSAMEPATAKPNTDIPNPSLFYPAFAEDFTDSNHLVFQVRVEEQVLLEESHHIAKLTEDGAIALFGSQPKKAAELAALHHAGSSVRVQALVDGEPYHEFSYDDLKAWQQGLFDEEGFEMAAHISVTPTNVVSKRVKTGKTTPVLIDCRDDVRNCACPQWASHPSCSGDPDGDGITSYYDNCDYVANANQNDCDGDGIGDKCDSNNVVTRPYWTTLSFHTEFSGTYRCINNSLHEVWYDFDVNQLNYKQLDCATGRVISTYPAGQAPTFKFRGERYVNIGSPCGK
ncbi:thrombospondin type 3 repeat-containing protein [Acanthopleuribacter pedis]|uniref:Thrombospondin type 3 repeat-containing protein n=1 Tax=Acanthopleuribacter pedis TaxID=442870 RepID=A0A8J7QMH9_9BACT|nr:thrombospondin type 3 repeat-containing protein [Acanthopleuribacter pedis]MBO1321113.1 thrombospondin type 3 repeat-containing protein [Acanthopleuribacter pedis]